MKNHINLPQNRNGLAQAFEAASLPLSPEELDRFWQLHQLLEKRNPENDLTRISGFYNLVYKHYIDGAMAAEFIEPEGLIMDIGTGAGFPGLPLAIRRPHWRLLLAEPRGRRLAFMEEAVNLLGLTNVEFYPHKVGLGFNRAINNFITRDFEPAAESLKRAAQILPPDGRAILMKGPRVDEELRAAEALPEWREFELEADRAYSLGESGLNRRLIVWRKKSRGSLPAPPPPYRIIEIASRENPRYKTWLKMLEGRGLKKTGQALIAGRKFIKEIIETKPEQTAGLIAKRLSDLEGLNVPHDSRVYLLRPELFPPLDVSGAGSPLLILNIPDLPLWSGQLSEGITVFLPFQDPANLGAAIRTSAALGARVVILKEASSPWHPKSLRASGPAVLTAALESGPSLNELAVLDIANLLALSPRGANLFETAVPRPLGLAVGLEGPGLDAVWPENRRLSIPMVPGVESLNAAASVAVSLGALAALSGK